MIVAIDSAMYDGGANCGRQVAITGNGKTIYATIADECPTCVSSGSLDLSKGAFLSIATIDAGVAASTFHVLPPSPLQLLTFPPPRSHLELRIIGFMAMVTLPGVLCSAPAYL